MVGRLVEQQEVGRLQQQAAERDPAALAARERADLGLARRHAQRIHGGRQRALEVPAVDRVDALLHLAHLGQRALHLVGVEGLGQARGDRVEAVEQVARTAHAVLDVLVDRARLVELGLLLEHADGGARRQQHVAADVRVDAAMMRRSELLPEPFAPSTPIFAPCRNASVMPSRTVRSGG